MVKEPSPQFMVTYHPEDEANFTHVRHSEAFNEDLLRPLSYSVLLYSGVASTDKHIVGVQHENGKCVIAPVSANTRVRRRRCEANRQ